MSRATAPASDGRQREKPSRVRIKSSPHPERGPANPTAETVHEGDVFCSGLRCVAQRLVGGLAPLVWQSFRQRPCPRDSPAAPPAPRPHPQLRPPPHPQLRTPSHRPVSGPPATTRKAPGSRPPPSPPHLRAHPARAPRPRRGQRRTRARGRDTSYALHSLHTVGDASEKAAPHPKSLAAEGRLVSGRSRDSHVERRSAASRGHDSEANVFNVGRAAPAAKGWFSLGLEGACGDWTDVLTVFSARPRLTLPALSSAPCVRGFSPLRLDVPHVLLPHLKSSDGLFPGGGYQKGAESIT